MRRVVAVLALGLAALPWGAPAAQANFDFLPGAEGFDISAIADGGAPAASAGAHPYELDFSVGFSQVAESNGQPGPFPDGDLRDLRIEMPPGLIANPNALDKCSLVDFHTPRSSPFEAGRSGESCPDRTQVGTIELKTSAGGVRRFGLFNLEPAPGVAAQLGAAPYGSPVVFDIGLRPNPDGSYVLVLGASNFSQALDAYGIELALWGTPWAASHDDERGTCLNEAEPVFPWAKCSVGDPVHNAPFAYLTLPTRCGTALAFEATASAWQQPEPVAAQALNRDLGGDGVELRHCEELPFEPQPLGFLTDTKASSASGYNFRLKQDIEALIAPDRRVFSAVRKAVVALPDGVTINPSVGAGLGACAPAQFAAESAFSPQGAGCPNAAKIGDFSMRSPLFDEWIEGAIYLALPDDPATSKGGAENPFDSLIAVYLVARLPARGILVKVAGQILPNPTTGTLTATFDGLPQIPYTDLDLSFRTGQRAFLISPARCGAAITALKLTPWAEGVSDFNGNTESQIETGIDGGPCPAGTPPFAPGAIAGGVNSNVGSYTPYFIRLTRRDTEQEITSYSLVLPKGITGKLAGIPFCPDAAIQVARSNRGEAETAHQSCPAASLVGHTLSGYGVGPALTYSPGRIYLAGPYHGSPLSLVTVNAATVGPFDLGTIVIRSAFDVDEHTAQLRIDSRASDPIPHIIDGVPLHLREVRLYVDRPEFTHNPSSCEASSLVSTLTGSGARFDDSTDDSTATVSKPFQLLNCLTLGFQPKLGLRLRGGSRRGSYPELRASFVSRGPQDSNLKEIAVTIPHQMFVAQEHIRAICGVAQFESESCPPGSAYGHAVAYTPLFDQPLRGQVYLRSAPGRRLPDLVASIKSGAVRIVLEGRIGSGKDGGIRAFFSNLPDAPIERFVLTLDGGRRGLLVNSANVCSTPPVASVKGLAQNNIGAVFTTVLRGRCGAKHARHKGHGRRG